MTLDTLEKILQSSSYSENFVCILNIFDQKENTVIIIKCLTFVLLLKKRAQQPEKLTKYWYYGYFHILLLPYTSIYVLITNRIYKVWNDSYE